MEKDQGYKIHDSIPLCTATVSSSWVGYLLSIKVDCLSVTSPAMSRNEGERITSLTSPTLLKATLVNINVYIQAVCY